MKISEFEIEKPFWRESRQWLCTDVCTEVIMAIELFYDDDPEWYEGPPYMVAESFSLRTTSRTVL